MDYLNKLRIYDRMNITFVCVFFLVIVTSKVILCLDLGPRTVNLNVHFRNLEKEDRTRSYTITSTGIHDASRLMTMYKGRTDGWTAKVTFRQSYSRIISQRKKGSKKRT